MTEISRAPVFHSLIIPSVGRPAVLAATVTSLARQTAPPDEIILSVTGEADFTPGTAKCPGVVIVVGPRGSSVQRNRAIDRVHAGAHVVTFLDDDVELAPEHMEWVRRLFAERGDVAVAWGHMIADGVRHGGIDRDQARALIAGHTAAGGFSQAREGGYGALGGNMHARRAVLDEVRFDERLALYGWLEDRDVAARCARFGKVGQYDRAVFVHLGVSAGRVSGGRYGFAQVMNPVYLWRKGSLPARDAGLLCAKAIARNALGAALRERRIDRSGRLRGNMAALALLLRRRVAPEYVARIR